MRIKEILNWAYEQLLPHHDSARLDAEVLLSFVIKKPSAYLLAHSESNLTFFQLRRYKQLIAKRKKGVPVAYLIGHKEFYLLDFEVNPHVLIPRPDTEVLVEEVIEYIRNFSNNNEGAILQSRQRGLRSAPSVIVLDVGTGTGCIPISVLKNVEGLRAIATDVSKKALQVAKRNAKKHSVVSRLELVRSDLLKSVSLNDLKSSELIVTANLPYLADGHMKANEDLKHEPYLALHGGDQGIDLYRKLLEQLKEFQPRAIFLEVLAFQRPLLEGLLPGYHLKYTATMTGEAEVMMLEKCKM